MCSDLYKYFISFFVTCDEVEEVVLDEVERRSIADKRLLKFDSGPKPKVMSKGKENVRYNEYKKRKDESLQRQILRDWLN